MRDLHLTHNGKTIHVVDVDALSLNYGFPISVADEKFMKIDQDTYVSTLLTFGDMANFVLGDQVYDFALPQSFWNSRSDWRDCVWLYEHGDHFGKPFNVKRSFVNLVKDLLTLGKPMLRSEND